MQDCKVAAVIDDTPFLHSGKNVLPELVLRNLLVDIFVLDNGGSQKTEGQVASEKLSFAKGFAIANANHSYRNENRKFVYEEVADQLLFSNIII